MCGEVLGSVGAWFGVNGCGTFWSSAWIALRSPAEAAWWRGGRRGGELLRRTRTRDGGGEMETARVRTFKFRKPGDMRFSSSRVAILWVRLCRGEGGGVGVGWCTSVWVRWVGCLVAVWVRGVGGVMGEVGE